MVSKIPSTSSVAPQKPTQLPLTSERSHRPGRGPFHPDPRGPLQERRRCRTSTFPDVAVYAPSPRNRRLRLMKMRSPPVF